VFQRFTLTRRRLTLAVVLVLAAVAAPLAWAAVSEKPDSLKPSATSAAARAVLRAPDATQVRTDVGDNPIQYVSAESTNVSAACRTFGQAGVNFATDTVTVMATGGTNAVVSPLIKGPSGTAVVDDGLSIPLVAGDGSLKISFVVKGNNLAGAAVGDLYAVIICLDNASPGTQMSWIIVLTGQKLVGTPTANSVSDFTARPRARGALLRWTTGTESNLLGFNVWRYHNGKGVKVNRTLVRAKRSGEPAGASYSFPDTRPGARRGLSYRLQLVDLNGKRTWYAAFAIPS
jgi:hypothetical protein